MSKLEKYSGSQIRKRGSSPKFLALNNALITSQSGISFRQAMEKKEFWGRLVETAIGAYLYNESTGTINSVMYWREGDKEVDFVFQSGSDITSLNNKIIAIEVKSGKSGTYLSGIESFTKKYAPVKKLLIGNTGIPVEDFLLMPVSEWFK